MAKHVLKEPPKDAHTLRVLLPFTILAGLMLAAVLLVPHNLHPMLYRGKPIFGAETETTAKLPPPKPAG